jgi:hypothetical protein
MEKKGRVIRLLEYLNKIHEEEFAAREQSVLDEWDAMMGGRINVKGKPKIVFLHGVARAESLSGMEAIMRSKRVGLLNAAGYYHDRADETAGLMELLGCEVDRTWE